MPLEQDSSPRQESARQTHLDVPALVTCVVAALAVVACVVLAALHSYRFVVLLLDRSRIPLRNAELFAACAWLGGALVLGLGVALLVRLMYRINGTVSGPPEVVGDVAGRRRDRYGRRR